MMSSCFKHNTGILFAISPPVHICVCVLPESVCVVTRQWQGVLFRGKCQLGTIPPHIAWFLSWKRHGSISRVHTKDVIFVLKYTQSNQTHPFRCRHPHCVANVPAWTCAKGGEVGIEYTNQVKPAPQMESSLSSNCIQKTTTALLQQYVSVSTLRAFSVVRFCWN